MASFSAGRLPLAILAWLCAASSLSAGILVEPARVVLDSPETTQQLLVSGGPSAAPVDLTRAASYKVRAAGIVTVDRFGLLIPRAEGRTEVLVSHNGATGPRDS